MNRLKWIGCLILGFLLLDAAYALYVKAAWSRAEKKIVRNVIGVREGCDAFTMGEGKTAILCVHGFSDSPALWRDMAPELAQAGYHVRAIRLSGFAGPPEEAEGLTSERWQTEVTQAFQELSKDHDQVWIAAHSLGAAVTLSAYRDMEDPVAGMFLIAPLLEVSARRSPVLKPRTWFRVADAVKVFTRRTQTIFPVDALDPEVRRNHPRDVFIPLAIIRSLFDTEEEAWASLDRSFPPVLLLQAGQDQVVDNPASSRFFNQIQSKKKECLVFPDSGHIIPRDQQWREAMASMLTFMQR